MQAFHNAMEGLTLGQAPMPCASAEALARGRLLHPGERAPSGRLARGSDYHPSVAAALFLAKSAPAAAR